MICSKRKLLACVVVDYANTLSVMSNITRRPAKIVVDYANTLSEMSNMTRTRANKVVDYANTVSNVKHDADTCQHSC